MFDPVYIWLAFHQPVGGVGHIVEMVERAEWWECIGAMVIKARFEDWFRIEDVEGRKGWISKTQLSNKLSAIVISSTEKIYKFPNLNSKVLAIVKKNFVIEVSKCRKNWCKVNEKEIKGWVNKDGLWGIN